MSLSYCRIEENQLEKIQQNPELLETYLDGEESLSIDKAWHAIHFMLTGQIWEFDSELGNVIFGGYLIGEEDDENFDYGYGPATYLPNDEVKIVAQKLALIDLMKLRANLSPTTFTGKDIYLFGDDNEVSEGDYKYIFEHLTSLIEYFQQAAAEDQIMIKLLA